MTHQFLSPFSLKRTRSFWEEDSEDYDYEEQWRKHYNNASEFTSIADMMPQQVSKRTRNVERNQDINNSMSQERFVSTTRSKASRVLEDLVVIQEARDDYEENVTPPHPVANISDRSATTPLILRQQHHENDNVQTASNILCHLKLDERKTSSAATATTGTTVMKKTVASPPSIFRDRKKHQDIWRSRSNISLQERENHISCNYLPMVTRNHCPQRRVTWAESSEILTYDCYGKHNSTGTGTAFRAPRSSSYVFA